MSIRTIYRVAINLIKIFLLKIKYKERFVVMGYQFWDPSLVLLVGKGRVIINKSVMIERDCYFSAFSGGKILVGEKTFFNRNCYIASRMEISIGSNCNFGPNVSIYDHDHLFNINGIDKSNYKCSSVYIGNNCWIGDGVKILRGTVIGEGSIIGAGSVVKGVIPPHSLAVGSNKLRIIPISNTDHS